MTSPVTTVVRPDLTRHFRVMTSDVVVQVVGGLGQAEPDVDAVAALFREVERECTRFDPESPLMQANAAADRWHALPSRCFAALDEAAAAYRRTDGLFDPRMLRTLHELGYDWELPPPAGREAAGSLPEPRRQPPRQPWQPALDSDRQRVRIGPDPVDLGGIGKGLAVRWAAGLLRRTWASFLISAGGDCYLAGPGPGGHGWHVGIEDPHASDRHVAIARLSDAGCATSSTSARRWSHEGRAVHHLIDPRTDRPAEGGLSAVTVVGPDTAAAEVWSKVLLLHGRAGIGAAARAQGLTALWVDEDGAVEMSASMRPLVVWQAGE